MAQLKRAEEDALQEDVAKTLAGLSVWRCLRGSLDDHLQEPASSTNRGVESPKSHDVRAGKQGIKTLILARYDFEGM